MLWNSFCDSLQVGKIILKYNFQNTVKQNALYMYKLVLVIIIMRLQKELSKNGLTFKEAKIV